MRHIVLAMAILVGCDAEQTRSDAAASTEYGLDNNWFQASPADVPDESQAGSQFATGELAPNFQLKDQFNDPVELYQFAGKLVILEVMPDHGTLVEELVEGECTT